MTNTDAKQPARHTLGRRPAVQNLILFSLIAGTYAFSAKVGLTMAFGPEQVTVVWPPSGIALAAVLVGGFRIWPAIWLGAFLANVTSHEAAQTAALIAAGNTLEAVAGGFLLRRFAKMEPGLERVRDVAALVVLGACLSTTVSATIGSLALSLEGIQPWTAFGQTWRVWWFGDAMGDLLVAPVLLAWSAGWRRLRWERGRAAEGLLLFGGLTGVGLLIFHSSFVSFPTSQYPLAYAIFPFLIWAALRWGQMGASLAVLLSSAVAIWATVNGVGPFAATTGPSLLFVQMFMGVIALSGLLLGAAIAERNAADRRRSADHAISQALSEAASLEDAMPRILESICETLDWDLGAYWGADVKAGRLECLDLWRRAGVRAPRFEAVSRQTHFLAGVGLPGRILASGRPAWIANVVEDANFPRAPIALSEGLHGAFGFPILVDGQVAGVLEFFSREIREPNEDLLRMFAAIGNQMGLYILRKEAQASTVEAQARMSAALETALDCVITLDHEGIVQDFNPASERTFGYSRPEVVGRPLADLIIPHRLREQHVEALRRYRQTRQGRIVGRRIEMPALRKDGVEFPAELTITSIERHGEPFFIAYLRDITERKESEDALRRLASKLQEQAETLEWAHILVRDAQERIVYWNRGAAQMYGWPAEEALGRIGHELLETEFPRPLAEMQQQLLRSGQWEGELVHRRKDGKPIVVASHWVLLHRASGEGSVTLEVNNDITELKKAREELRHQSQLTKTITDSAASCLCLMDHLGIPTYVNPAFERVTGYTLEELRDRPMHEAIHHRRPDGSRYPISDCPIMKAAWTLVPLKDHEDVFVRKDGTVFPVRFSLAPLEQEGRVMGAVAEFQDVTSQKRAEEELREADRRKNEFLAVLAHELRNPLAPIRNAVEVLRQPAAGPRELEWARDVIDRQVSQLARLVDDLLDVARITRGKVTLQREPVSIREVIARAVETNRSTIEKRRQRLTVRLPEEGVRVDGDLARLAQVGSNLIENASKYTDEEGAISLDATASDGAVVIRVRDSGIGIAPQLLPDIFEPFTQADRTLDRSKGGLGIGLTLVKKFVEMHGGTVQAFSEGPGHGSEFVVRLPLLASPSRADSGARRPQPGESHPPRRRRILVVEDNEDSADSLRMLLAMEGHDVRVASEGQAALEEARRFRPEIVLLDIGLPGMSGYEVARLLRADPRLRGACLVALTGYGQDEDRRLAREAGFDQHIVKPAGPEALRAVVLSLG